MAFLAREIAEVYVEEVAAGLGGRAEWLGGRGGGYQFIRRDSARGAPWRRAENVDAPGPVKRARAVVNLMRLRGATPALVVTWINAHPRLTVGQVFAHSYGDPFAIACLRGSRAA